jgi:hypothetical protein
MSSVRKASNINMEPLARMVMLAVFVAPGFVVVVVDLAITFVSCVATRH